MSRKKVPVPGGNFGGLTAALAVGPAGKMLPPRGHGVLVPGPQAHAMKLGFEKYFLWKARYGYVQLP